MRMNMWYSDMQGEYVLGYWGVRGRGQVLRHLLAYTGLPWREKTYKDLGDWYGAGDKTKLGLDFPNLPYLSHGDFKMSESAAIARYICAKDTKHSLLGKTAEDQARVDMVLSLLEDIFSPTYSLFFSPNHDKEKVRMFEGKVKAKLEELDNYIAEKQFVLGYITLADFKIAEAAHYFDKLYGELFQKYTHVKRILKNVEELPEITKYRLSEHAINSPFLPTHAQIKF